jgi:hypothetical protein
MLNGWIGVLAVAAVASAIIVAMMTVQTGPGRRGK